MLYIIEPVDNFFFRGPAPFEAGGESFAAAGMFPPLPSVYGGVFRSLVEKNVGTRFRIGFSGLWIDGQCYFPKPMDLYLRNKDSDDKYIFKTMKLKRSLLTSFPLSKILYIPESLVEKEKVGGNYYLQEQQLSDYLNGNIHEINGIDINSDYVKIEKKIGIEIDPISGVSKKEQLYQTVSIRPAKDKGLRLAVECNYDLEREMAMVKLGGEGKLAKFSRCPHELSIIRPSGDGEYFKLYLATPAIFKNGWLPSWINEKSKTGYFKDSKRSVKVKLVSACVGKNVLCGGFGFDKEEKQYRPRELRYGTPAGSVYYFKLLQGTFEDAVKLFHMKCISDYRESMGFDYRLFNRTRYCDRGFGYSFVGKWNGEKEGI